MKTDYSETFLPVTFILLVSLILSCSSRTGNVCEIDRVILR